MHRPALTALALAAWTSSAWAVRPPETNHLGVEPVRVRGLNPTDDARFAAQRPWQEFLQGDGAGWEATFDPDVGTPFRMWGPGVPLGPSLDEASVGDAVLSFARKHAELLGVEGTRLQLRSVRHDPSRDAWYADVDTLRDGLPIWRGGLTFRILQGALVMAGAETFPGVPLTGPATVSRRQALSTALAEGYAAGTPSTDVTAERMLLPDETQGKLVLRRVWRLTYRTEAPRGDWVAFVDATTGEHVTTFNTVRFFEGTLDLEHDVRLGNGNLTSSPLRFAEVSGAGGTAITDETGTFDLPVDSAYEVDLEGPRVRILDQQGNANATLPAVSEALLTADDFAGRQSPLTTFVYLHQAQDWANAIAPEVPWTQARVDAYVNIDDVCNAYFDGDVNFFRAGSGCNNTGRLADVIFHEWGHGFHTYSLLAGFYDGSVGEGAADTMSFLMTDDPRIAPNFFTQGFELRNVDNDARFPDDFVANEAAIHSNGLIFGGSMWDTREALRETYDEPEATDIMSSIFAGLLKGGPDMESAYFEALFADDDDGDLGNGTPHQCELITGFGRHGLGPLGGQGSGMDHEPITDAAAGVDIPVEARLESPAPECFDIRPRTASVHYRINGDRWTETRLLNPGKDLASSIPGAKLGDLVEYWIRVEDEAGAVYLEPSDGRIRPHTFYVGDVLPIRCDDFEADDGGFSSELLAGEDTEGANDWMWGEPLGLGGDPSTAASGERVWGNDLGGGNYNGQYQNERHNRLTSPRYRTRHYQDAFLRYKRWLHVEDGFYDQARILADGEVVWTNWATTQFLGDEHHLDDAWADHVVDLAGQADDGRVRLAFEIISDQGLAFGGWTLDDVCLYAPATADNRLGISDLKAERLQTAGPVALSWTQPEHAPVETVRVVRTYGDFPDGPDDGTVLYETDAPELGAPAQALDAFATGKADLHYAVYAFDGTQWLGWTIDGWNAVAVDPGQDGGGCGGCTATPGTDRTPAGTLGWLAVLGLGVGLRRRRD